jgi:hypothetical protein
MWACKLGMPECTDFQNLMNFSFTINMILVLEPYWGPPNCFSVGGGLCILWLKLIVHCYRQYLHSITCLHGIQHNWAYRQLCVWNITWKTSMILFFFVQLQSVCVCVCECMCMCEWVLRFSRWSKWGFSSSGIWHLVNGWLDHISRQCRTYQTLKFRTLYCLKRLGPDDPLS